MPDSTDIPSDHESPDAQQPVPASPERPPVDAVLSGATREGLEVALDLEARRRRVVEELRKIPGKEYMNPNPLGYNHLAQIVHNNEPIARGALEHPAGPQAVVITVEELDELVCAQSLREDGTKLGFAYVLPNGDILEVDPEWIQDEFFVIEPHEVGRGITWLGKEDPKTFPDLRPEPPKES